MSLNWLEGQKLDRSRRIGFIPLEWREGAEEVTGWYGHHASVACTNSRIDIWVAHVITPETMRKKYEVVLIWNYKSDVGDLLLSSSPHIEMDLDSALVYGQWQATVLFRLIEGEDAKPGSRPRAEKLNG